MNDQLTPNEMSRREFIESHGATCANWQWSWSFINEKDKFVIIPVWEDHIDEKNPNRILFINDKLERNNDGKKRLGYSQAIQHICKILCEGYALKTFIQTAKDPNADPRVLKSFISELRTKRLGLNFYVCDS